MRRSVKSVRSALLLLAFVSPSLVLARPDAAAAQVPAGYEEGIVEVIAERLAPLPLIVLIDSAGSMLLPVEHITYYLGLAASWSGTALSVPSVGGTAQLDTATNMLTAGGTSVQLAPAEVARNGPVLYLRAERLAALLDAAIQVDFSTLTVALARDMPFPAQQRIIAEQRRAVVLARQRQIAELADLGAAPYAPATGGGILDWEIATSSLDPTTLTTVRTDAGAALLGGELGAGASFELGSDAGDHVRDISLRYHRVFPRARYIRQISGGDILTGGLFARFVRGAEISNRPFLRSHELSAVLVQPDLPAGWEYEVFQGNQLLGYSDLTSHDDPVAVPLRAGTTPVQVRMYGPAGEEVVTTLLYQTPVSLLLRDEVEYSIGGGRCASACDEFAHADVRYGATALFTVGGGFELLRDTAGSRLRPYFVYSMASGQRATAELTYMPFSLYSANIALFPRDGSRANIRGGISRPGLGPISLVSQNRMRWDAEALWDERIERRGSLFSQVRFGTSASGLLGSLERWRVSSMASFSRGFAEVRYDHDNTAARAHLLTGRTAVYVPLTVRGHTLRPLFNTALGVGNAGFSLAEAGISIQPRPGAVINAGVQWNRGYSRPTLSIGYTARTGPIQSGLRAVSSESGVASSSLMARGSAAVTHDGSFTFDPSARTGYAGAHGIVFIDRDGNGIFSDDDRTVAGAHIVVGDFRAVSDENGRYRVWGMQPYRAVPVAIDSARTPDPSLTTARTGMVIRPAPNMAVRLDMPLVQTSELIGTLVAGPEGPTVAGISLDITNLDTGEVTRAVSFSDGLFYVSRVRPGAYTVSVSAASLEALGAAAAPRSIDFVVPATGDEPVVELAPIRISPR